MSESYADLIAMVVRLERERNDELAEIRRELARLRGPGDALKITEFARRAGCSPNTVRKAIDEGRIRVLDLGDRTVRIHSSELEGAFVDELRRRHLRAVDGGKPADPPAGRRRSRKAAG